MQRISCLALQHEVSERSWFGSAGNTSPKSRAISTMRGQYFGVCTTRRKQSHAFRFKNSAIATFAAIMKFWIKSRAPFALHRGEVRDLARVICYRSCLERLEFQSAVLSPQFSEMPGRFGLPSRICVSSFGVSVTASGFHHVHRATHRQLRMTACHSCAPGPGRPPSVARCHQFPTSISVTIEVDRCLAAEKSDLLTALPATWESSDSGVNRGWCLVLPEHQLQSPSRPVYRHRRCRSRTRSLPFGSGSTYST